MHTRTSTTSKTIARLGAFAAAAALGFASLSGVANAEPPHPGCGYGDDNHSHQAAPGRDPQNLRPGASDSDRNHDHTAPPGQTGETDGDQSEPRRGCR